MVKRIQQKTLCRFGKVKVETILMYIKAHTFIFYSYIAKLYYIPLTLQNIEAGFYV